MPALYALGQHKALEAARARLLPDELLVAFLDGIYLVTAPERAREAFEVVRTALKEHAGVEADLGKCRVWNRAGEQPPRVAELGPEVWRGSKPLEERGLKVLGVPLGSPEFVAALGTTRLQEEQRLTDALPELPDLQSAWLLLLFCASPRANHWLRVVPPEQAREYAQGHDKLMLETLGQLVHCRDLQKSRPRQTTEALAQLPLRLGGLGLRSAVRNSVAAYWASWADTLPVLQRRCPRQSAQLAADLEGQTTADCLKAAQDSAAALQTAGFAMLPTWQQLRAGERSPRTEHPEPGEWLHGWQHHASSALENNFRERTVLSRMSRANRAMLRSQAGPLAGRALAAVPSSAETTLAADVLQVLLRRRLRLSLPLQGRRCVAKRCDARLDSRGDHYAACPATGRLRRRAGPMEVAVRRVLREAGARMVPNARLCDLGVRTPRKDDRNIEAAAFGLPLFHGLPLLVDVTMVSPLHADGTPWRGASSTNGVAARQVSQRSEVLSAPEVRGSQAGGARL